MKDIFNLILRFQSALIFFVLEIIALCLIVLNNNYQNSVFSDKTSAVSGFFSDRSISIINYFSLKDENLSLIKENIKLKNELDQLLSIPKDTSYQKIESKNYFYRTANITSISYNRNRNYVIIDKGNKDGILPEMAVMSNQGVVGLIKSTSNNFSIVIPLINLSLKISAKIKKNNYYGTLQWGGQDYTCSNLEDIPFHVNVNKGDTIVTSGFSSIFPEGELIGFVDDVERKTANFLKIKVKLAHDFKRGGSLYIIENLNLDEINKIKENNE